MPASKTDLRIVRTRKSIMEAFITLSEEKEFKDITVKDITEEAMINRATFYYHFEDIYDLLEKALAEVLLIRLDFDLFREKGITEESLLQMFEAITDFQKSLSHRCHRGYEETIARIIRDQLEVILYRLFLEQPGKDSDLSLKTTAVMLSWALYGASEHWKRNDDLSPRDFLAPSLPAFMQGREK